MTGAQTREEVVWAAPRAAEFEDPSFANGYEWGRASMRAELARLTPAVAQPAPEQEAPRRENSPSRLEKRPAPETADVRGDLALRLAVDLYDRFVMGGWEPSDAVETILASGIPLGGDAYARGYEQCREDAACLVEALPHLVPTSPKHVRANKPEDYARHIRTLTPSVERTTGDGPTDADIRLHNAAIAREEYVQELQRALADANARVEVLENIYQIARGLCHGYDWNYGTHALEHGYKDKLIVAIDAVAPLPDQTRVAKSREALRADRPTTPAPGDVGARR